MPRVRFAIVGAGKIAKAHAEAFKRVKHAKLVAICDINPEAAQSLANIVDCPSYDNYQTMVEAEVIDTVLICTPPATHADICRFFLNNRIHVLCEKPLSIDYPSALQMVETAQHKGLLLTMASKFRYVQDVIQAKNFITSGKLGQIIRVENTFTGKVQMSSSWHNNSSISGGGVLIDNGTHSVDILRYLLGEIRAVQVVEGKRIQGLNVEETIQMSTLNKNGVVGDITLSWSFNAHVSDFLKVYGSEGVLSVGWQASSYHMYSQGDWVVFGNGYDKLQALGDQIDNFALAMSNKESLRITSEDALAAVKVIATAYKALEQNQWFFL